MFRLKYKFHQNSSLNRRGVAILVRNELDFVITDTVQDQDENVIFIAGTHSGTKLILGSVYGPNDNNKNFFEFIEATLARFSDHRVCLGGDWNTTVSSAPVDANPDVFNMRSIPSLERTNWLATLMENCRLIDPFRYANPTLTDFSYFPYGNVRKNRSRIDFFLISDTLVTGIKKCDISHGICKRFFDHKSIYLLFGSLRRKGRKAVNNRIVFNPIYCFVVILAMYETYISHIACVRNGIVDVMLHNLCSRLDSTADNISLLLDFCGPWAWKALTPRERERKNELFTLIELSFGAMLSLDELSRLPRSIDDDEFFEKLISGINQAVLELQQNSLRSEKLRIKVIKDALDKLKAEYNNNRLEIENFEDELGLILEQELEDKVRNYLKTEALNDEKMTPMFLNMAKSFNNDSIMVICDQNNSPFTSAQERGKYIADFYKKLYELPGNKPGTLTG